MPNEFSIAVVGATGAVGGEFLSLFESRHFPIRSLRLYASERSAGETRTFKGIKIPIEAVHEGAFEGVDFVFFSAGASRSRALIPHALEAGACVIDNSSAFRMDREVALTVPEVNPDTISLTQRLYAVPNCTAGILGSQSRCT